MIDRDAIIAEIVAMTQLEPREPEEFTVREFLEKGGANCHEVAGRRLNRLVKRGRLERRKALVNGRECWVYRKPRLGDS